MAMASEAVQERKQAQAEVIRERGEKVVEMVVAGRRMKPAPGEEAEERQTASVAVENEQFLGPCLSIRNRQHGSEPGAAWPVSQ